MSKELKPCPFCGGEAHIFKHTHYYSISCTTCFAGLHLFSSKEEARDTWNKRTFEPAKGSWLLYEDEFTNAWECSVCHEIQQFMDGTPFENHFHYCPNCSAKMEQESKS